MAEFENLNPYQKLDYLEAQGAEELKTQLLQIKTPINIISMYAVGSRHICWILTQDKINKIKKDKKNGNS
ncbi:hypothetical protein EKK58_08580 [Candidatus Dependentiae bacterium]|nr:MAG: hypothetical protein EKK58_08580 [Candidatus Dependentiae bacterium]